MQRATSFGISEKAINVSTYFSIGKVHSYEYAIIAFGLAFVVLGNSVVESKSVTYGETMDDDIAG